MAGKLGMKRTYLSLWCKNGHRRSPSSISIRPNGDLRCMLCERSSKKRIRYGLDDAALDKIFEAQGRRCAACGATETTGWGWHTDYSHRTKQFRGILCDACNKALGHAKDSIERLQNLIEYLNRTEYANLHTDDSGQHKFLQEDVVQSEPRSWELYGARIDGSNSRDADNIEPPV